MTGKIYHEQFKPFSSFAELRYEIFKRLLLIYSLETGYTPICLDL